LCNKFELWDWPYNTCHELQILYHLHMCAYECKEIPSGFWELPLWCQTNYCDQPNWSMFGSEKDQFGRQVPQAVDCVELVALNVHLYVSSPISVFWLSEENRIHCNYQIWEAKLTIARVIIVSQFISSLLIIYNLSCE